MCVGVEHKGMEAKTGGEVEEVMGDSGSNSLRYGKENSLKRTSFEMIIPPSGVTHLPALYQVA